MVFKNYYTKARSRKTHEFGVEEIDWPIQSPHFNPIAHLWNKLEAFLSNLVNDLRNGEKIPTETLQKVVESLQSINQ